MEFLTDWELKGQRRVMLRWLERKFGALPATTGYQLMALTLEQLDALADALLDFTTLADLEAWLMAHPPEPYEGEMWDDEEEADEPGA